jgi:Rps23 Pro-64 3,4-dihydroxylase Tpa1-like proline 4-hydroxylase
MNLSKFDVQQLSHVFMNSAPFNHVIIDNFFDESYLNDILNEINDYTHNTWYDKENASINNEPDTIVQSKKIALTDYNKMGANAKTFIDLTRSEEFIKFLVNITGIDDLENDMHLFGGGIHKVNTGGRLAIHSDFNIHPVLNKYRRLNILLYLNKNWQPDYNGELELWSKDMKKCEHKIAPIFNRMVIFRITDDAFHGHPDPWCSSSPRLSFALYYYTQNRPEEEKAPFHWALWQKRPNIGF